MSNKLKITQLRLNNIRQFKNICFDFINTDTNEPIDKVCFIGANGTGKTTLLKLLSQFLKSETLDIPINSVVGIGLKNDRNEEYFYVECGDYHSVGRKKFLFEKSVEDHPVWHKLWSTGFAEKFELIQTLLNLPSIEIEEDEIYQLFLGESSHDLAIYASPDGSSQLKGNLPISSLNDALKLTKNFPIYHEFSHSDVSNFWNVLIYQIKQRESVYFEFLKSEEVRKMPVEDAEQRFNVENPEILTELANLWNDILAPAGLEFGIETAKIPIQLTDNLQAYIVLKDSGEIVQYNQLSTGIRNFIFRFGHIFSLYFNRKIERGFLLVDEPEASLFPDLLFNIIGWYESIIQNTQFFVATHSPIVAAQFKASERFILEFDENGYVQVRQGVSPEGDDPNDLLMRDFSVRSLYGKKGIENWERYLELRQKIAKTDDVKQKTLLLDEYMNIGKKYNFSPNELF